MIFRQVFSVAHSLLSFSTKVQVAFHITVVSMFYLFSTQVDAVTSILHYLCILFLNE